MCILIFFTSPLSPWMRMEGEEEEKGEERTGCKQSWKAEAKGVVNMCAWNYIHKLKTIALLRYKSNLFWAWDRKLNDLTRRKDDEDNHYEKRKRKRKRERERERERQGESSALFFRRFFFLLDTQLLRPDCLIVHLLMSHWRCDTWFILSKETSDEV